MTSLNLARWQALWNSVSAEGESKRWFEILATRYAEPQRHYHSAQHIVECLEELDPALHLATMPAAVELAVWFHDVIYDPRATDNEQQSAALAKQCLESAGVERALAAKVESLVLATRTHEAFGDADTALVLDVDLSILGKPPARFQEYEVQIRMEYSWVPDHVFFKRRSEILKSFLDRERLYNTDHFYRRYERQARLNLQTSLEAHPPDAAL